jgi:hypothetical protein
MEPRVVPSVTGLSAHHARHVSAHVGQATSSAKAATASEQQNNKALKQLRQQQHLVYVHSLEHVASALPTKAEQEAGKVSSVLKSIEQSL